MVSIREYYFDWRALEPATMTIECLDADGPPARVTAEQLVEQLEEAAHAVEDSMRLLEPLHDRLPRQRAPTTRSRRSLGAARASTPRATCSASTTSRPTRRLIIETDVPDARYWSLQLYTLGWFEAPGIGFRTTSINHVQAVPSSDGRVRAVLAHRDPGVPNWIDTQERLQALVTLRSFWVSSEPEMPSTRVVKFDDVARRAARRHRGGHTRGARRRARRPPGPHRDALPRLSAVVGYYARSMPAAVDHDRLAVHVARAVGQQERDGRCDVVLGVAVAAHRVVLVHGVEGRAAGDVVGRWRAVRGRRGEHAVDDDAVASPTPGRRCG